METGERTRRKNHSLILLPDERAKSLPIETQAVKDYLDGLTPYQQELTAWGGKQGCLADGAPVFFVPEGNIVRYFGHSPNFRIPARLNVAGETRAANPLDFVPANLRQNDKPDLADAIFGWVEESEKGKVIGPPGQRAGRVFFGDSSGAALKRTGCTLARLAWPFWWGARVWAGCWPIRWWGRRPLPRPAC